MARVEVWESVINTAGVPVSGESVHIYDARTTNHTTVYAAETGPTTLTQPVSTTNGAIPGWVEEGEYDLTLVTAAVTVRFNAIVGGNPSLGALTIDTGDISDDAIVASKIAAGAVGSSEIAADAVGSSEIATDAVTATEIAALAVGTAELDADAVTAAKIADDAVGAEHIAAGAVGASEIAADAVGSSELTTDAVDTASVQNLAITAAKIDLPAITTDGCAANASGFAGLGAYSGTGATLTLTSDGVYLIWCAGWVEDNAASSAVLHVRSTVLNGITETDNKRVSVYTDAGADAYIPINHSFPVVRSGTDVVLQHAVWPEDTVTLETQANAVIMRALRISGG